MSYPPGYNGTAATPRTVLSQDRGGAATALLEHLGDEEQVTELLDCAELNGDAQVERARVGFNGVTWVLDLFGVRREAAA